MLTTAALIVPFLFIDLTFLSANLLKVFDGGWMPLLLGAVLMAIMYTWRRGTAVLYRKTRRTETPIQSLLSSLERRPPHQVPGTAVFLTGDPTSAPTALLHSLKHYKVLHERNVILTVEVSHTPTVPDSERVLIEPLGPRFPVCWFDTGLCNSPICRTPWRWPVSWAGSSTSCPRRSSCRGER